MGQKPKVQVLKRDEFLSLVSHEIKNPLTSITGYAEFAADAVRNQDVTMALESLQVVRAEAKRVLRLAEDLLDAAQVREGKFSVTMDLVNLEEIVWEMAGRYATTTGHSIDVKAIPADFPHIVGDPVRLRQVIENLVSNAAKYAPVDSRILILLVACENRVAVSVWNTGPAIPPEKIPTLFSRFTRLSNGGKRRSGNGKTAKGTGLGLFISKQIVEMHGGTIEVFSQKEEGTIFTVRLPQQPHTLSMVAI